MEKRAKISNFVTDETNVRKDVGQCCNTAPVFFPAYGLWLFMAIRFPAYGRKSKFDEKAVFWVIRLNTAFSWEMWLFW